MKKIYFIAATVLCIFGVTIFPANSNIGVAPANNTGGPPSQLNCASSGGCHNNNQTVKGNVNSGKALIDLTYINGNGTNALFYDPGFTSTLVLTIKSPNDSIAGFEIMAVDNKNKAAGVFSVSNSGKDSINCTLANSLPFAMHKEPATHTNTPGQHTWTFNWTPPLNTTSDITFYYAVNQANGDSFASNLDSIYTRNLTLEHFTKNGIEHIQNNMSFNVFPTLVKDHININYNNTSGQAVKLRLVDINGQTVHSFESIATNGEVNQRIELPGGLASGLYFVKMIAGTQVGVKKIVIE